jgi:hypothetical protein
MPAPQRAVVVILACAALAALGVECRTWRGPASRAVLPPLEIAPGELDDDALDARLARIEAARGLPFLQRPRLELFDAGDPRLGALVAVTPVPLVRRAGALATAPLERTGVDPAHERISLARPADDVELDVALAFLLDSQHSPRLVATAAQAPGDVGLALRALLAASALATAEGGLGSAPASPPADPLAGDRIEPAPPESRGVLDAKPIFAAQAFLRAQHDREAAFRAPPLSTEQLLRPERRAQDDRPVWLAGPPPALPDCELASDASVGVFALLRALVDRGASAPAKAVAAWRGDRLLVWRCGAAADRWLYAVELDDEPAARAFEQAAARLLPEALGAPDGIERSGRRVAASRGIDPAARAAFGASLQPIEIRRPEDALGLGAAPEARP